MYEGTKGKEGHLAPSYPMPFKRLNIDYKTRKMMKGYMNDGTGINPSDPNSMFDNGPLNNAVCNIKI